jgi:CRP/FNR family transcriptional regulator, cyclic AMP receptor protein
LKELVDESVTGTHPARHEKRKRAILKSINACTSFRCRPAPEHLSMPSRKPGPIDYNALPELLRPLAERSEIRRFRKGSLVLDEGDRGDSIYIVLAGELRAFTGSDSGRHITYGLYGPGDWLGEMGLDGGPRMASVEALADSTCALVERPTLLQYISERPAFAMEIIARVIQRARVSALAASQFALNDAYGRLKRWLDAVAQAQFDGTRLVREPLAELDLPQRLGCSREMAGSILRDLEHAAIISLDDGRLRILRELPSHW